MTPAPAVVFAPPIIYRWSNFNRYEYIGAIIFWKYFGANFKKYFGTIFKKYFGAIFCLLDPVWLRSLLHGKGRQDGHGTWNKHESLWNSITNCRRYVTVKLLTNCYETLLTSCTNCVATVKSRLSWNLYTSAIMYCSCHVTFTYQLQLSRNFCKPAVQLLAVMELLHITCHRTFICKKGKIYIGTY